MFTDPSPTSFVPDIDCDFNFYDHIEDLLDSPQQNVFVGSRRDKFPSVWNDSPFSRFNPECTSDLAADISFPYDDDVHMEWLSASVENSFGDGKLCKTSIVPQAEVIASTQFHLSSPISVLESSSSSSSSNRISNEGKVMPISVDKNIRNGYGRARSKRPRPPSFNPEPAMQLISKAHSSGQKKIKIHSAEKGNNETNSELPTLAVRKCLHCEITKTPQWRTGPMGPKTLCNACGVRHKSGRLFPEYRPAASPTFVPSLHSNSHKKVIEMRISSVNISSTTTATLNNPIA